MTQTTSSDSYNTSLGGPSHTLHDDKRIVFQHTRGRLAGLYRIMGLCSEFGIRPDEALPSSAEGFEVAGTVIAFASLVKDTGRYALYRELLPFGRPQKTFDARQV